MQEQVSAGGESNAKIEGVRMSEEDSCSEGVCVGVGGGSIQCGTESGEMNFLCLEQCSANAQHEVLSKQNLATQGFLFSGHILLYLHSELTLSSCSPLSFDRSLVCHQNSTGWCLLSTVCFSLLQWLVLRPRQHPTKETTNRQLS